MRISLTILFLFFIIEKTRAQCDYSIAGVVQEEHTNEKLSYASVQLVQTAKVIVTDSTGTFSFENLCAGEYSLAYTHPGCKTEIKKINVPLKASLVLTLHHHEIDLNEVTISQHRLESSPTQTVVTLKEQALFETRGASFSESLKSLTGVNVLKTGSVVAKPLIHGMTGNRILLINNGVRVEGQQWGSEHAPEIDVYLAKKLTLIKGASAIRYGSEAIAGVILSDPEPLPTTAGIGAEINYVASSVNGQHDLSLLVQGNHVKISPFSWRVQGTYRRGGDVATQLYLQRNTGFREANGSLTLAWKKQHYGIEVFGSFFSTKIGILSSSHTGSLSDLYAAIAAPQPKEQRPFSYEIGRPYQQVQHTLAKVHTYFLLKKGTLYFDVNYQLNVREEFDKHRSRNDSMAKLNLPALKLWIQSIAGELRWEYHVKKWQSQVGAQFSTQTNTYKYGYLIPAYWNFSGGAYAIERWSNNKTEVELGARLDYKWMQAILYERGKKREPIYQYIVPTVSVGLDHHFSHSLKANLHVSLAWRSPAMSELFVGGLHHSTATVEIGNEKLKSEKSLSLTTGIHFQKDWIDAEVSVFSHLFKDYIYAIPDTTPFLTIRGFFPVLRYIQTDAAISGSDINLTFFPIKNLSLTAKASLLFGRNLKTNDWLEQLPSHRFQYGIRYDFPLMGTIENWYIGMNVNQVLKQTQLPTYYQDYLPAPAAYWLLGFDCGASARVKNQRIVMSFSIQNMLNRSYRDYMNRFRYFTDEAGLNVTVRVKIPLYFH